VSAPTIHAELQVLFPKSYPSLRTVQRLVAWHRGADDPSGPWKILEAPPAHVAAVLPILAEVIKRSEGRTTTVTQAEAGAIVRVQAVAPSLDPHTVYFLAAIYVSRTAHAQSTADLDLYLGFQPWLSHERLVDYEDALARSGVIPWHPIILAAWSGGGIPDAEQLAELDDKYARVERLRQRLGMSRFATRPQEEDRHDG
jgi:hypothetical protein